MHIATIHTPFPSLARVLQMPAAFMPDHSVGVVKPLVNILALVAQSRRTHLKAATGGEWGDADVTR
jgi:hypothetical protein